MGAEGNVRRALEALPFERLASSLKPLGTCPGCGASFPAWLGFRGAWEHLCKWEDAHVALRRKVAAIVDEDLGGQNPEKQGISDANVQKILDFLGFKADPGLKLPSCRLLRSPTTSPMTSPASPVTSPGNSESSGSPSPARDRRRPADRTDRSERGAGGRGERAERHRHPSRSRRRRSRSRSRGRRDRERCVRSESRRRRRGERSSPVPVRDRRRR
mmetsp:Transcript_33773/g.73925  ORF Transcript_33773/g.73925 Transcript_33773/m.73925 type:complete len:216 (+) Transcript_33773:6-653(+)